MSSRLPAVLATNRISQALAHLREAGVAIVDLTESNPTRVGLMYPESILGALGDVRALRYDPHPFGLRSAREAVAQDCRRRGVSVDPDDVVLTASTSESYSWLFKLLCDPGETVLAPVPSYPLFEQLTRLEAVQALLIDSNTTAAGTSTWTPSVRRRRPRGRSSWSARTIRPARSSPRRSSTKSRPFAATAHGR